MRRAKAWRITAASCLAVLILWPGVFRKAISYTCDGLIQFLWNLLPVFLCVGLMDVWVEKERMIKILGKRSGFIGVILSLFMGMLTAVPVYALLPIAGLLVRKGGRISNVLLFVCSSVSIRLPLFLFETSSLGWKFSVCRFLLNLPVVIIIGFTIEILLSEDDVEKIRQLNKLSGDRTAPDSAL